MMFSKFKQVPSNRKRHRILAGVAGWAVCFSALFVIFNPQFSLRIGLALLAPLLVFAAFYGSFQAGSCPLCGASSKLQKDLDAKTSTSPTSQTDPANSTVEIGWHVLVERAHACSECKGNWQSSQSVFVAHSEASNSSSAQLVALNKLETASNM